MLLINILIQTLFFLFFLFILIIPLALQRNAYNFRLKAQSKIYLSFFLILLIAIQAISYILIDKINFQILSLFQLFLVLFLDLVSYEKFNNIKHGAIITHQEHPFLIIKSILGLLIFFLLDKQNLHSSVLENIFEVFLLIMIIAPVILIIQRRSELIERPTHRSKQDKSKIISDIILLNFMFNFFEYYYLANLIDHVIFFSILITIIVFRYLAMNHSINFNGLVLKRNLDRYIFFPSVILLVITCIGKINGII